MIAGSLAARLAARGLSITWAASAPAVGVPDGVRAMPLRAWDGVRRYTNFAYPIWHPADLQCLAREAARHSLVHMHEHLYLGHLLLRWLVGRGGPPVVVTQHTSQIPAGDQLPLALRTVRGALAVSNRTVARWVFNGAKQVVFISEKAMSYYSGLFPFHRPPMFIPNGVDAAIFSPPQDGERNQIRRTLGWPLARPVALFVGRMIANKGVLLLRELAARVPECDFAFAGAGPLDPGTWGIPNVHRLGSAEQRVLARYYRAADLLILPSFTEGFPLVMQEAMACGTPVLLTDHIVAGAPNVSELAYLWRPECETLEMCVRAALADRGSWPARRQRAASFASEAWNWSACVRQYEQVFAEAVL
jgi:glycosyltransferase involved in cell wall biosynthesis